MADGGERHVEVGAVEPSECVSEVHVGFAEEGDDEAQDLLLAVGVVPGDVEDLVGANFGERTVGLAVEGCVVGGEAGADEELCQFSTGVRLVSLG
ncbi:hypothetical protein [Curtobacterium sp. MCBD17_040]|uniref:hypothetical protein n=1 Tax=Curtobacterium sp. MCBD17_040 TaxID=2175674 RepID=UPI0011B700AC|nr:hypothetical protein [Curtobacterium sp. MCBD17_040]WIB65422.1 hypothetical protein DEI94_18625 [Curtobacterium sp. MCBD17_040]